MLPSSPERITQLCDDWHAAAVRPGGKITSATLENTYHLLPNGINFPNLNHDGICAALLGLTKTIIPTKNCTTPNNDHLYFWSWCGEPMFDPSGRVFQDKDEYYIEYLYTSVLRAGIRFCSGCLPTDYINYLDNKVMLAYLTFPLLESY